MFITSGTSKKSRQGRDKLPQLSLFVDLRRSQIPRVQQLLVQGLGVGGGGRNVGVTGSLVRAGGELELVGSLQVGIAGGAVGGGVILEVEKKGEHFSGVNHDLVLDK